MRLVHIVQEIPYPPNHGGRVDCWRRIQGLHELGHASLLVTWTFSDSDPAQTRDDLSRLGCFANDVIAYEVDRSWKSAIKRLLSASRRWPSHQAARILSGSRYSALLERSRLFSPEIVMLDGLQGLWVASRLARDLNVPLVYRAHNREHLYVSGQRRLARTIKQMAALTLALQGLEHREREAHRQSLTVLDISLSDLAYWSGEGFDNGFWLPPLVDRAAFPEKLPEPAADLAYLGNLQTPNNVGGILWFLDAVWPKILASKPNATALIGGSDPVQDVVDACQRTRGVRIVPNVEDPLSFLLGGRVLFNPVGMSSGVNVKMIDMLATGKPVVSTPSGAAGLSSEMQAFLSISSSDDEFASLCLKLMEEPVLGTRAQQAGIEKHYGLLSLELAMAHVSRESTNKWEAASIARKRGDRHANPVFVPPV